MALYDPVNGVYRKVKKLYEPVSGVYRNVTKAFDPVDGVYRQYFSSATPAWALAVGDSVWMKVNGVPTEFLVVHQGNPDRALYDESCNGTWLVWKKKYATTEFRFRDVRDLTLWLTGDLQDMLADAFDSNVQVSIKSAKIPYYDPGVHKITNGVLDSATKFFLLSGYEVGFTKENSPYLPADGACLDYFSGSPSAAWDDDNFRMALRSAVTNSGNNIWSLHRDGAIEGSSTYGEFIFSICPAFILDSNTIIE